MKPLPSTKEATLELDFDSLAQEDIINELIGEKKQPFTSKEVLAAATHYFERALSKFIPNGTSAKGSSCPECDNQALEYQEGCLTCKNCGYTKCS